MPGPAGGGPWALQGHEDGSGAAPERGQGPKGFFVFRGFWVRLREGYGFAI